MNTNKQVLIGVPARVLTGKTITDSEINALLRTFSGRTDRGGLRLIQACIVALQGTAGIRESARRQIAAAYNACSVRPTL